MQGFPSGPPGGSGGDGVCVCVFGAFVYVGFGILELNLKTMP